MEKVEQTTSDGYIKALTDISRAIRRPGIRKEKEMPRKIVLISKVSIPLQLKMESCFNI